MCPNWLSFLWWILRWIYYRVCCCSSCKIVYLLDPVESQVTRTFARKFQYFVDPRITFESVKSCSNCKRDYPIALLIIRQIDRSSEEMESALKNLKEDFYKRTVVIYIHTNQAQLPTVLATRMKDSKFCDILGDILDFGLIDESIQACYYDRMIDSNEAFKKFVLNRKANLTLKRGYNSLP